MFQDLLSFLKSKLCSDYRARPGTGLTGKPRVTGKVVNELSCTPEPPGSVTFLFGAGASIGALPPQAQIAGRVKERIRSLEGDEFGSVAMDVRTEIKVDLSALVGVLEAYGSVDHFVYEQLQINGKALSDHLKRVKRAYALFWILEQREKKFDPRYMDFLKKTTELYQCKEKESVKWKPDYNALSWNYDLQIELAALDLYPTISTEPLYNQIDSVACGLGIQPWTHLIAEPCRFFKLNGTAGLRDRSEGRANDFLHLLSKDQNLAEGLNPYPRDPEWEELLDFAVDWPREPGRRGEKEKQIEPIASATEELVVIGYSFFPDNKSIDGWMLSRMEKLKTIYIQNVGSSFHEIRDRIGSLRSLKGIEVIWKDAIGQPFFIPP